MENSQNHIIGTEPQVISPEEIEAKKASRERINTSNIQTSYDFRALVQNLNEIGDITTPDGRVYKKDYLIKLITNLKGSEDENLQYVTNTYGLRDKVKKLLLKRELGV